MRSTLLRRSLARLERRRRGRGMAVFLVVLVLTLVSAIGVFSMRSASLVDLATGFNRQNVQATLMAEYGARAAASYLGEHTGLSESSVAVSGCAPGLLALNPSASCLVLKTSLLSDLDTTSAPVAFSDGLAGLLSPSADPTQIQAEFVTEIVEPGMATISASPGFESADIKEITITSTARVYPTDSTSTGVCTSGSRGTLSQQSLRAHAVVVVTE
jgi:Tfp pilus assembly protein PilX